MYCHFAPVARSTATPARCGALPIALTAKLSCVFFDKATSSPSVFAATDGCTTSMCGEYASIVTPTRSRDGSKGSFVYTDPLIANAPTSHNSSVCPSGGDLATRSVPRLPLAPARVSIQTVCLGASDKG